jgi:hypothetical protein
MQQRLLEDEHASEDQRRHLEQQALGLYAGAISGLRRSIDEHQNSVEAQIPLACLLMVILESIRGSSVNMLVHLQSGFHIMRTCRGHNVNEVGEVSRLLRQYAVDTTVFDSLNPSARVVQQLIAEDPTVDLTSSDPHTQVNQLAADVLRSMAQFVDLVMYKRNRQTSYSVPVLSIEDLRSQQQKIEEAVNAKIAGAEHLDACEQASYGFAKARCLMARIYIDCAWSGYQVDYDNALELFREIVDLEEKSLRLMQSHSDQGEESYGPSAFSVGLSAQSTLMMVIQQCRDVEVRRRAMELLDQCPRYDGVRNTALVKAICRAIIDTEESAVGGPGQYIPEQCRVHHYRLVASSEEPGRWRAVKLYRRSTDSEELLPHTVALELT